MEQSCTGRQVVGLLWMLSLLILGWPVGIAWADDTRLKPSTGVSQPTPQASPSVTPKQAAAPPAEAGTNPQQSATTPTDRQAHKSKLLNTTQNPFDDQHPVAPLP